MDKTGDILQESIDERIESFLRGTMGADEEIAFKQEIKSNPELRKRAMAMTSLIRGLQARNTAIEESIIKEKTEKSRIRQILWWACSVAAVFAIFFGVYKDRRYNKLDSVVSPYYMEYDTGEISRGDVDSVSVSHLYTLFAQIRENRRVSGTIKELEPIYFSLDEDITYLPWANDIAWNLALAYVKDDQIEKAVSVLEKIKADNPDTFLYNRADELIKKLSDL